MVVVALMGMAVLFTVPFAGTMIRRAADVGAITTIRATLAGARLHAIKSGANVVVVVSRNSNNGIHLEVFRDKADLAAVSPNDGDLLQESGEPRLSAVDIGNSIHFWKQGSAKDDLAASAPFDGYLVNSALDPTLKNRIVFLPTGGIALPQNSNSGTPQASSPEGRGIYFADAAGKNFVRVTIASPVSSEARVDKYEPGRGYVSTSWGWK
jgi:hypothetical protein